MEGLGCRASLHARTERRSRPPVGKPRPKSGLDRLMCATFAQHRSGKKPGSTRVVLLLLGVTPQGSGFGVWSLGCRGSQRVRRSNPAPEGGGEDRVLDGPASGEKGSKGGPSKHCNPRTAQGRAVSALPLGLIREQGFVFQKYGNNHCYTQGTSRSNCAVMFVRILKRKMLVPD